ncbi:MAG: hypothetical protein KC492_37250 [Myxococcales bacterium]|nr:hypothetical protein [Myxococcales bacterium]
MSDADRRAILARRALFVASALTSVSGVAQAAEIARASQSSGDPQYELPALSCPVVDAELDKALLGALLQRIEESKQAKDWESALSAAERAFEESHHPLFLFEQSKLERELGRFDVALQHFRALESCAEGPVDKFREEVTTAIESLVKQPVIVVRGDEPLEVTLDGASNTRAMAPEWTLRVAPGKHLVLVTRQYDKQSFEVLAEEGDVVTIEAHFPPPRPCLSPAVCLEPPPPPPPVKEGALQPRLELGVLPLVPLGKDALKEMAPIGAGARLGLDYGLSEGTSISFGVAPWVLDGVHGLLVPLGGFFDFNLHLGSAWVGLGVTSGYELGAEGRILGAKTPQNGFFLSPELTFFGIQVSERVSVATRVQTLLGSRASEDGSDFGVTHVGVGIWIGYRFGGRAEDDYEMAHASSSTF